LASINGVELPPIVAWSSSAWSISAGDGRRNVDGALSAADEGR
jgi:hypothetical protein